MKIAKKSLFFILCVFATVKLQATDNFPIGSRQAALSNAAVALTDIWAISHNQGALGFYNHFGIAFHHENKFVIPEYSLSALAITVPVKPGVIGFTYSYFGYAKYNESKFGLAYAKSFGKRFSAGVQIDYFNSFTADMYGNAGTLAAEAGILAQPIDNFFIGAHVFNPTGADIPEYEQQKMPVIFKLGMGYRYKEKIYLGVESEKDIEKDMLFKVGLEYLLIESIYLRSGITSGAESYSFGLGYQLSKLRGDIAFTRHEILGFTPHFSLIYEFR